MQAAAAPWVRTPNGVAFADIPTVPGGRVPDFCIIGAAKCGTTSLNAMLDGHPAVFMNPLKEPHYYSTDAIFARGPDWYRGHYAKARPDQICGEASTSYSRHPLGAETPARMAADNPAMRLIYVMREPVARLRSHCLQQIKFERAMSGTRFDIRPLDGFLDMSESTPAYRVGKVEAGEYETQILRYLDHFPAEQLHLIFHEDLVADPDAVLRTTLSFLGLDATGFQAPREDRNRTDSFLETAAEADAVAALDRLPLGKSLRQIVPASWRAAARTALGRRAAAQPPAFSAARREALRAHYAPLNDALRRRTGRALATWS